MIENDLLNSEEFILEDFELNPVSSAETIKNEDLSSNIEPPKFLVDSAILEETTKEIAETEEEIDPVFAELAVPKLPELQKENRARLQMQSPNRLFFYWSIKNNPFQTLTKVLGGNQNSYQLVAKLLNKKNGYEELHPVEAEGNWWFNVEADANYQAEIGFFAPNRPFVRVMYSNTVETPRKTPSLRQATDADWAISAAHFAEVLDNAGFTRDAFEVALAGDDEAVAKFATENAFTQLIEDNEFNFSGFSHEEVRFALLALASGISLSELREHISEALFSLLQENIGKLSAEKSLNVLEEHFEVFTEDIFEEETVGAAVYGLSLVNFPKTLRKRAIPKTLSPKGTLPENLSQRWLSKLSPISSFDLGK